MASCLRTSCGCRGDLQGACQDKFLSWPPCLLGRQRERHRRRSPRVGALAALILVVPVWAARRHAQVVGAHLYFATECELPAETAARVLVSGGLTGDGYRGLDSVSLVLTNPTDWRITEITVEFTAIARHETSTNAYALRAMRAVGPGGSANFTARLDDEIADPSAFTWRYIGARGLPPQRDMVSSSVLLYKSEVKVYTTRPWGSSLRRGDGLLASRNEHSQRGFGSVGPVGSPRGAGRRRSA